MRLSAVVALAAIAGGPAAADDVVSAFVRDAVTVYEEPAANEGWRIPQCAFELPAAVLATSANMRLQLDSPDGPVWVATADAVTSAADELPSASMSRAKADAGWVTRAPWVGGDSEAPPESDEDVILVAEADAGGGVSAPEAPPSRALIVDPQDGIGGADACDYVARAVREAETDEAAATAAAAADAVVADAGEDD